MSGPGKNSLSEDPSEHIRDAKTAVSMFAAVLPDPEGANAIEDTERPLSLIGAAAIWSGWLSDVMVLREDCLVLKAQPPVG